MRRNEKHRNLRIKAAVTTLLAAVMLLGGMPWTVSATASKELSYTKSIEAKGDDKDDKYTLSLNVSDVESVTSNKVDIVMVIDTSDSMNKDMGGEITSNVANTRIEIAKKAVTEQGGFADIIAGSDRLDANIAVVTFDSNVRISADWQSLNNASEAESFKDDINNIIADGGTLTQGGIREANRLLGSSREDAKKIVVLISDGRPTYCYSRADDALARVVELPPALINRNSYYYLEKNRNEYNDLMQAYGFDHDRYMRHKNYLTGGFMQVVEYEDFGRDDMIVGAGNTPAYSLTVDETFLDMMNRVNNNSYHPPVVELPKTPSGADDLVHAPYLEDYLKNPDIWNMYIPRDKDASGNYYLIGGTETDISRTSETFCTDRAVAEAEKMPAVDGFYALSVSSDETAAVLHSIKDAVSLSDERSKSDVSSVTDKSSFISYFNTLAKNIDAQICSGITISDELSEYVDMAEDPSYSVKITDDSGNTAAVTDTDESYPFESIEYDKASRKVIATFKSNYTLKPGCTYELLFDVDVNVKAYKAYFDNIQADPDDGYGGTKGNAGSGTDSADKPGFYSNADEGAELTLQFGHKPLNDPEIETYTYEETPVAQIMPPKTLTVRKEWKNTPDNRKTEIKATLTGTCTASGMTAEELEELKIVKQITLDSAGGWEAEIKGLPSKYYEYSVTEDGTPLQGFLKGVIVEDYSTADCTCIITNEMPDFDIEDGKTETIDDGHILEIRELAFDSGDDIMTPDLARLLDEHPELCGTITYQWMDEDGNEVGASTTAQITETDRVLPDIPSYEFRGEWKGEDTVNKFTLKVTFANADGAEPVIRTGDVFVNVEHTVVPTGIRHAAIPGMLLVLLMLTGIFLTRTVISRRDRDDRQ